MVDCICRPPRDAYAPEQLLGSPAGAPFVIGPVSVRRADYELVRGGGGGGSGFEGPRRAGPRDERAAPLLGERAAHSAAAGAAAAAGRGLGTGGGAPCGAGSDERRPTQRASCSPRQTRCSMQLAAEPPRPTSPAQTNRRGATLQVSHYTPVATDAGPLRGAGGQLPAVVYCHCNSGSRRDAEEAVGHLLPMGIGVVAFDFMVGVAHSSWCMGACGSACRRLQKQQPAGRGGAMASRSRTAGHHRAAATGPAHNPTPRRLAPPPGRVPPPPPPQGSGLSEGQWVTLGYNEAEDLAGASGCCSCVLRGAPAPKARAGVDWAAERARARAPAALPIARRRLTHALKQAKTARSERTLARSPFRRSDSLSRAGPQSWSRGCAAAATCLRSGCGAAPWAP